MSAKRTYKLLISGFIAFVFALQPFAGVAHAATVQSYTATPFVAAEWAPDRTAPSGGYSAVTFGGRTDVAEIKIDKDNQSTMGAFYHTEGIQRQISASDSIKADLYVDNDWLANNKTVRAGLWGVAKNSSAAISSYPILEFTTDGFTGWRAWDSPSGTWVNLAAPYTVNAWNTLELVHNTATGMFDYKINGTTVSSHGDEASVSIGAVILNSKNYGTTADSYDVHWSGLATGVATVEPEVTAQDFGTEENTVYGFKGITAGFGLVDFDEVDSITVTLSNTNGVIVTNTATPAMIQKLNAENWTQFSSPFVVSGTFADDYCNGGPCWTTSAHTWTVADKPTTVTATVTGKNAAGDTFTESASNTALVENPSFESMVPAVVTPPNAPADPTDENETPTTVTQVSSTSTTFPSVVDDFTDYSADDEKTLGAADNGDKQGDDKKPSENQNQNGGLAWYWWVLIIATAAGAGWWLYTTYRNRTDS